MSKTYIIGTRGSLLAKTQSTIIKNQLEKLLGESFELKFIKTQGDLQTEKPLWQMDGKDFFTKELDRSLLDREVDLVIHSYKDLATKRPEGIKLAAVTERKYPQDILLIKKSVVNDHKNIKKLIIGTSSPRRIVNIQNELIHFLPQSFSNCEVECKMLRGNVNTRIEKLLNEDYHAIVLALAGLERLAMKEESSKELEKLVSDLDFMVLPLRYFPTAAAQGALAIECLEDNKELADKLSCIHHQDTQDAVRKERQSFSSYGGGCHLAVGINAIKKDNLIFEFQKGEHDGKKIDLFKIHGRESFEKDGNGQFFIGLPINKAPYKNDKVIYDQYLSKKSLDVKANDYNHFFITSNYCIQSLPGHNSIRWASGATTMIKIAKKDLWCHGCSDGFGHDYLKNLIESKAIKLLRKEYQEQVTVLSARDAKSNVGEVIGCYERIEQQVDSSYQSKIEKCQYFFWSSYPQYLSFSKKFPEIINRHHFCGPGKTYKTFNKNHIKVNLVADMQDYYQLMTGIENAK